MRGHTALPCAPHGQTAQGLIGCCVGGKAKRYRDIVQCQIVGRVKLHQSCKKRQPMRTQPIDRRDHWPQGPRRPTDNCQMLATRSSFGTPPCARHSKRRRCATDLGDLGPVLDRRRQSLAQHQTPQTDALADTNRREQRPRRRIHAQNRPHPVDGDHKTRRAASADGRLRDGWAEWRCRTAGAARCVRHRPLGSASGCARPWQAPCAAKPFYHLAARPRPTGFPKRHTGQSAYAFNQF